MQCKMELVSSAMKDVAVLRRILFATAYLPCEIIIKIHNTFCGHKKINQVLAGRNCGTAVMGVGLEGTPGTPLCPGGSGGIPGTPLCPGDSGEGGNCGTAVVFVGMEGIPGTLYTVSWGRRGNPRDSSVSVGQQWC